MRKFGELIRVPSEYPLSVPTLLVAQESCSALAVHRRRKDFTAFGGTILQIEASDSRVAVHHCYICSHAVSEAVHLPHDSRNRRMGGVDLLRRSMDLKGAVAKAKSLEVPYEPCCIAAEDSREDRGFRSFPSELRLSRLASLQLRPLAPNLAQLAQSSSTLAFKTLDYTLLHTTSTLFSSTAESLAYRVALARSPWLPARRAEERA